MLNRIDVVVPPWSAQAAATRDEAVNKLLNTLGVGGDLYQYHDVNSGWGTWAYYFICYAFVDGITTVGTVFCSGMTNPPTGSNILAAADPGVGSFPWGAVGTLPVVTTSSWEGGGRGTGSVPAQNASGYVWRIPGSSSTAAADFTAAIAAIAAQMPNTNIFKNLFKYVDSVSGAWSVYCVFFSPGMALPSGAAANWPNSTMMYTIACSGSPHPPSGSGIPAVSIPGFAETFVTITAPLNFGPTR